MAIKHCTRRKFSTIRTIFVCPFRRLRDKLIADERLSLAMEVSTKCGIDPAGVWSAMGFACLQLGDFAGARDKFSHCLKVSFLLSSPCS